jgi:hypothetical protein
MNLAFTLSIYIYGITIIVILFPQLQQLITTHSFRELLNSSDFFFALSWLEAIMMLALAIFNRKSTIYFFMLSFTTAYIGIVLDRLHFFAIGLNVDTSIFIAWAAVMLISTLHLVKNKRNVRLINESINNNE